MNFFFFSFSTTAITDCHTLVALNNTELLSARSEVGHWTKVLAELDSFLEALWRNLFAFCGFWRPPIYVGPWPPSSIFKATTLHVSDHPSLVTSYCDESQERISTFKDSQWLCWAHLIMQENLPRSRSLTWSYQQNPLYHVRYPATDSRDWNIYVFGSLLLSLPHKSIS